MEIDTKKLFNQIKVQVEYAEFMEKVAALKEFDWWLRK